MKFTPPIALCLGTAILAAGSAHASSSAWFETDGGRFRLVTTGQPDASGKLQGVLDIELKPGWKTYWRDPGNSGVPPQIDLSASRNVSAAEISYPAPQRHDDGYAKWAGYDFPVRLPVSFTVPTPGEPAAIAADVFLGICETICVPVQARLEVDPAADPGNGNDAALVAAALGALPSAAQPDFGATLAPAEGETISITAAAPGDPEGIDIFVAGVDGYQFGTPQRHEAAGKISFLLKVLERPTAKPAGKGIPYTLISSAGAVEGFLPYP
ncbi:protein-disulfide reductase DsbD domain-containing protein [Aminobacter niigataensis]|uniref:protein-disulfide reductase DsbD domain-containing protein n=1 Tax=Aminobacter niigataensis TaxID=83265 RepID=UPI0024C5A601|nr:protein-disulfide reductase DsbD domain-containing protein [Aminobacter niigataensis]CAI2935790.1 DsbC domain-containing protein [Aminobacter niigataensis]